VVGPNEGSKAREVLWTPEQLDAATAGDRPAVATWPAAAPRVSAPAELAGRLGDGRPSAAGGRSRARCRRRRAGRRTAGARGCRAAPRRGRCVRPRPRPWGAGAGSSSTAATGPTATVIASTAAAARVVVSFLKASMGRHPSHAPPPEANRAPRRRRRAFADGRPGVRPLDSHPTLAAERRVRRACRGPGLPTAVGRARAARRRSQGTTSCRTAARRWDTTKDAVSTGIGDALRAAREAQGLSLDEAAADLRARPEQLRALEEERFTSFGGDVYAKGFLKNYAVELGIDPKPLLDAYRREVSHDEAHGSGFVGGVAKPPKERGAPPTWIVWLLAGVVIVAGFAFLSMVGSGVAPPTSQPDEPIGSPPASAGADDATEDGAPADDEARRRRRRRRRTTTEGTAGRRARRRPGGGDRTRGGGDGAARARGGRAARRARGGLVDAGGDRRHPGARDDRPGR
jgi:hypothetical protein